MINLGIVGYGNLGRGLEIALQHNPDYNLVAVFTRRDPEGIKTQTGAPVVSLNEVESYRGRIDVMVLCGGSASDLPKQGLKMAQ